ncbi:methionyl-tRNA formyltransferase [Clostridium sp. BJN0001]|uniref:methionyl-tRNA formyltransferase n=1 Tax=Clostridium sp. BJN0001 TaxID=2930219 RepID=UPI001FD18D77|nr:methionyl-tRNA formyltransferase [Clostridium sp. BJN0001]
MKIVFMGTADFAVPTLAALIEKHDVLAVITQPDKRKGRGKKISFSPVKEEALKHSSIPVYQPVKIREDKELIENLKKMNPDFIVVVAYGQILTKEILDIPKYVSINLHGSHLPMYRGAAPINWAIIKGEKVTGNTTMVMDEGIDTGDMLLKDEVIIDENMTAGELTDVLKEKGSSLLIDTIEKYSQGNLTPVKQNGDTFYAKMLDKEHAVINWDDSAENIHNFIRGLNPWPIAYTSYNDQKMKIYETEVTDEKSSAESGTILDVSKKGIKVMCKDSILLIKRIQFPNGKPLEVKQYINGHSIEKNILLK